MAHDQETPLDRLWAEYEEAFADFDDLSLARWMAQTLGQLRGRSWRLSHPLVAVYRVAARAGHERQIWHKRLATPPPEYFEASCCRAPLLPLLTRDILDSGLLCPHCGATAVPFEEIDPAVREKMRAWAADYKPIHAVAHWDERQQTVVSSYEGALDEAAETAEELLLQAGKDIAPACLEFYPAVLWEDHDECLEVRPEDLTF